MEPSATDPRSARKYDRVAVQAAAALACLALAPAARAHQFCVSTAAQLQQALTESSDNGAYVDEINEIDVVQGTYETGSATGGGPFTYASSVLGVLALYGGYDPGCATRDAKASLTVLDGKNATQVLSLRSKSGGITVSGFTIQNGETDSNGGGLTVSRLAGDASISWVLGNIIRNNHTTAFAGGVFVHAGGAGNGVLLQDNVIVGNSADLGSGAGRVFNDGDYMFVFNNTVAENTTALNGGTGGLYCDGSGDIFILNNIFWNNSNSGIHLTTSDVYFEYNDVGTRSGSTPMDLVGNVSVAPSFINSDNGNFHLAGDSPLLGFSPTMTDMSDADGHLNPTSGRMDLGAFETTIFVEDFDGFGN